MRFLYLDDSGKPHDAHQSRFVAYAGFSVDESNWHSLVRQLSGAKARHYAKRGSPHDWEIKCTDYLSKNAWNRSNNRRFCLEVVDILVRNDCTVYAVYLDKSNAKQPLADNWVVPRCFQVLAAKFERELARRQCTGTIVCDWSTYTVDRHVTRCVQSLVVSRGLSSLIGDVTYASSEAAGPIQICDLISGAYRMYNEGAGRIQPFMDALSKLAWTQSGARDVLGFPVSTVVKLF